MGEPLICPACNDSPMYWINPDQEDLLETGVMECKKCGAQFVGMPGWIKAREERDHDKTD